MPEEHGGVEGKPFIIRNDLTLAQPRDDMTRGVIVYRTTLARWIEIVGQCTGKHFDAVGFVTNVFLGVFFTAIGPAISDFHTQNQFAITPWIATTMLSLFAIIIAGAVYLRMGSFEKGSLVSLTGELTEHKNRYDDQGSGGGGGG